MAKCNTNGKGKTKTKYATIQAADYHGVNAKDIERYIKLGRISGFRLPVSLGGRNPDRKWSYHFVLRSAAKRLVFVRGSGSSRKKSTLFTPRADAWLLKARDELHMTFIRIGRTMKIGKVKVSKHSGGTNVTLHTVTIR